MATCTVKFVRDTAAHEDTVIHREGDVLECSAGSRDRWLRRGAVEVVTGKAANGAVKVEDTGDPGDSGAGEGKETKGGRRTKK